MTNPQSGARLPDVARTPAQRGTFGWWLTEAREARYKTQKDALAAMRRLAGLYISASEYSQWESGSRVPRDNNPKKARLYEFFGGRPPEEPEEPTSADVVAAIERLGDKLAAAISAQAEAQARSTDALADMLGGVLSQLSAILERTPDGPAGLPGGSAVGSSRDA